MAKVAQNPHTKNYPCTRCKEPFQYCMCDPQACRSCGTPGWWCVTTKNKKNILLEANGDAHFAKCPQADEWRKT